jgi:hypothetical protein
MNILLSKMFAGNCFCAHFVRGMSLALPGTIVFLHCMTATQPSWAQDLAQTQMLKSEIIKLAQSYAGQGDRDYSKQKSFEPLIERLLLANPQKPLVERLPLLYGVWQQVWGPYEYRGKNRGVDPEIGVDEIYQADFPGGYYYNVTPLYKGGDRQRERIALLRGEYKPDSSQADVLLVRFTRYPGLSSRPQPGPSLPELPALVEAGKFKSDIYIVPTWIVRLFFGRGALKEVYTDADLRILYGADSNKFTRQSLYIMTRVVEP